MNQKWDLSKIIKNKKEFNSDIENCKVLVNKIVKLKGTITKDAKSLYNFLTLEEELNRKLDKIIIYSYLNHYKDTRDSKYNALKLEADNLIDEVSIKLSFISNELMELDNDMVKEYIKEEPLIKPYKLYLEKSLRYKSHILSKEEEQVIAQSSNALGMCSDAFNALNSADIKLGYIKDEKNKKVELTLVNYSDYIKSRKERVRKDAFNKLSLYYKNHINTISSLYLGNIKEHFYISNVRKYKNPLEMSLFDDKVSVTLYDNLIKATHKNLKKVYKYYSIKQKDLKLKEMHLYDVYLSPVNDTKEKYSFDEAINIIKEALKPLGEDYINDLTNGINNGWIDSECNEGKRSGAYSWGCYDSEPYLSVNFNGDYNDISTLIHELGHSMHSYYSNKNQNYCDHNYPIFLAEIASTVNEILLNKYMTEHAKTDKERRKYVYELLESIKSTVVRQVMFAEFERDMFLKYEEGIPVTKDLLNDTYYELNEKYFGPDIIIDENIKYEWARVPHFYTPFYVYKYATGFTIALIIVNKLFNEEGFKDKYIKFLSTGGNGYPLDIIKKLGIVLDEKTLSSSFDIFDDYVKILERK